MLKQKETSSITTLLYQNIDYPGLSESFEVHSWVVKVNGQTRDINLKNAIHKEMPSRVTSQY